MIDSDFASRPASRASVTPRRSSYAPTEYFMGRAGDGLGRNLDGRLASRARRDPQLLLALAVVVPVVILELTGLAGSQEPGPILLAPAVFLAGQLYLTSRRKPPAWLPTARLALTLTFVALANVWADPSGVWPLRAMLLPVIAMAASQAGRGPQAVAAAGLAMLAFLLLQPAVDSPTRLAILALLLASVVVALGSRSVVSSLERSQARLLRANSRARRRARELAAVESVGSLLAREGPAPGALDHVMGLLEQTFGYHYPSVYLWDGVALQLGAQRNYQFPIQTIAPDRGILGRVVRTRQGVFLPDARSDPDFLYADPNVVSEISLPLESGGELLGILNVETSGSHRLDEEDWATMQIVADRLSAALALGRERQKLTERAALLDRLTTFATVLGSSLDPTTMDDEVASGAAIVIPSDMVVLVQREPSTGEFRISGVAGGDRAVVGRSVEPGEGVSGRAIATRTVVVVDRLDRTLWPKAVTAAALPDVLGAMAAPMVTENEVVGVISWFRGDLARPYTSQEREVAALLASKVGLALANARLHQQTRAAAITDPLTGIHNRRHFDAAIEREDAIRRRTPAEKRRSRSAILFDLDHFGKVNKRHGHQVGDRVLRLFAETLRARARASDLVARYGGEEFVVVLDDATREAAASIAEEVRAAFARLTVEAGDGQHITTTVSAGCATLEAWEIEGTVLLERADVALAMAKAAGRDKVVSA